MSTVPVEVPPEQKEILVSCAAGCGTTGNAAEVQTWDYLPIQDRRRCWPCTRALAAYNNTKDQDDRST